MNVLYITGQTENKHWITVNNEHLTKSTVERSIEIRGELENKLNTNEYNYVLFKHQMTLNSISS